MDGIVPFDFQKNALRLNLKYIPGLQAEHFLRLEEHGITKASHLVGQYFCVDRDFLRFVNFLTEMGIENEFALECANAINEKFGKL
jgi:hypothetical protein